MIRRWLEKARRTRANPALPKWIDRVVVVSLPASTERRARLDRYLPKHGIDRFDIFDAAGPDDPEVRALFAEDRVQRFPPCFRCGTVSCGKDDCNNILIPPQVANVVTFRRLWSEIARRSEITLVMEDDIVLHTWAPRVWQGLETAVQTGQLDFQTIGLVRLGWAKGRDHAPDAPFALRAETRMSNPLHLITPDFAAQMAEGPGDVRTTSDIMLHDLGPRPGQAITAFPPIGSDLSWSTGAVASTIHPKPKRSAWLAKQGKEAAVAAHNAQVKAHRAHVFHRPVLITGHPRTGTGFVAGLCAQAGLDIGHETNGADGVSSWMMAAQAEDNPWSGHPIAASRRWFHADHILQTVRDPQTALASILREDSHAPRSLAFRQAQILAATGVDINAAPTAVDRACLSLCLWAEMIDDATHVVRIEDGAADLLAYLTRHNLGTPPETLDLAPVNADKLYQGARKPKPQVDAASWAGLAPETIARLYRYCTKYGYNRPAALPDHLWPRKDTLT